MPISLAADIGNPPFCNFVITGGSLFGMSFLIESNTSQPRHPDTQSWIVTKGELVNDYGALSHGQSSVDGACRGYSSLARLLSSTMVTSVSCGFVVVAILTLVLV